MIALKGYRGDWPEMKLAKEGERIRLYARSGDAGFVFGGRSGGVETSDMKPFWPFALVESESTPNVTPVWTGCELKTFTCPKLPDDFEWQGERIRFGLNVDISADGVASVQKYWTHDAGPSNRSTKGAWKLTDVAVATAALERWEFYPAKQDGEKASSNGFWDFDISQVNGMIHWVIDDYSCTVFDSMPRLPKD